MEPRQNLSDIELLRDSLVELDRARQHERTLRLESEGLLKGLRVLNEATDRQTVFDQLALVFRDLIPFQSGSLLLRDGDVFRLSRSTKSEFLDQQWTICSLLQRVIDGESIVLFDALESEPWTTCAPKILQTSRSVMLSPIKSETMTAIMVFLHDSPSVFTSAHISLVKRFTPLINQVLTSIEVHEKLQRDHENIQQVTLDRLKAVEELRRADEDVRRIRDLMSSAISFAPIYVWEIDEKGFYSFVEGSEKVLGWKPQEIVGQFAERFVDKIEVQTPPVWADRFVARLPMENVVVERRHKNGQTVWTSVSGSPITDGEGNFKGFRGVTTDVTEAIQANQKLAQMALHDALTGLANRRKFMDFFENEEARLKRYHKPMALLALDLDHFKRVNDEHGHLAGDDVLIAVANVLKGMVRKTDLVARFGGEEFMILLPETDGASAFKVADKIRTTLEAEVISAQSGDTRVLVPITVSIGVSSVMPMGRPVSFDDLMERADQALYAAKQNGRNQVCVEDDLSSEEGAPHELS